MTVRCRVQFIEDGRHRRVGGRSGIQSCETTAARFSVQARNYLPAQPKLSAIHSRGDVWGVMALQVSLVDYETASGSVITLVVVLTQTNKPKIDFPLSI